MNRLVTDDPQTNTEVMLNLAYVKDKEVWIRGAGSKEGEDISLIDLCKDACEYNEICPAPISRADIETIGDLYMDCSMHGCKIGLMYFLGIQAAELRERLRTYEEKDTPVFPKKRINNRGFQYYYCGKCGHQLPAGCPKRCDNCGQSVKWNE